MLSIRSINVECFCMGTAIVTNNIRRGVLVNALVYHSSMCSDSDPQCVSYTCDPVPK